jgi:broad specificity phosphatase PhoE
MPSLSSVTALPRSLWLIRHGESAGNVARDDAERRGLPLIAIAGRDIDVPLSELGKRQSRALGQWLKGLSKDQSPTVVLSSPYARAKETAELLATEAGLRRPELDLVTDERLREKEFGSLNRFTKHGILERFPAEAERRAEVGKFYYRPPGGESWCDVILRLRSVLDHIKLQYAGESVLIVAHQVIVLCFRYLLEELDEQRVLAIDREQEVLNCSLTSYHVADVAGRQKLQLERYNFVAPLEDAGAKVTQERDPRPE